MTARTESASAYEAPGVDTAPLLQILLHTLPLYQSVSATAELGVADQLADGPRSTHELARALQVNEPALHRVLRLLASQHIFEEVSPRVFANTPLSNCLRSNVPGSLRGISRFRGSHFAYGSFGELLHSIRTGEPARHKVLGMDGWEYLAQHPDLAQIFDDAMTDLASIVAPTVVAAYDFSKWESVMDIGGGNGVMLSTILRANPGVRGVLADQGHVLDRARQRGFLSGDLEGRSRMTAVDLFGDIPVGCRAYLLMRVIHDWNDDESLRILRNCRKAVPDDGALLLVEQSMPAGNDASSGGLFSDVSMMVLTGGRERTVEEYRVLFDRAQFRLTHIVPTKSGFNVLEAVPM